MGRPQTETSGALALLRDQNARSVLRKLLEHPEGITQLELAGTIGLARSTVSILLSETLRSVLTSSEREEGERGPPPRLWSVVPESAYSVGVDIGKSHVTVALANAYGEIVGGPITKRLPNTLKDPHGALDAAGKLLEAVVESSSKCRRIAAVMVGLPGVADTKHGFLIDAAAPAWADFNVFEEVHKRWPFRRVPSVEVENDANLGALGELYRGAGRAVESLLFIKWSTGIGSGMIFDGKLWEGKGGAAGELGHLTVNPTKADRKALRLPPRSKAEPCPRCEQRDCIEQIAGGPALAAALGVKDFRAVVSQAYDQEDLLKQKRARATLNTAAKLIGTAIGPALTMLNVERVILGGIGGNVTYPLIVESLRQGLDQTAPPQARTDAQIEVSDLGDEAYVVGAALTAFERRGIDFLIASAARGEGDQGSSKDLALAV